MIHFSQQSIAQPCLNVAMASEHIHLMFQSSFVVSSMSTTIAMHLSATESIQMASHLSVQNE